MVNSKQKGNRAEREVVELCKKWWDCSDFMRSPDSGAMSTMLEGFGAPEDIVSRLAGDLLVPADFPFCIEVKHYKQIDLYSVIRNPTNNLLVQWWGQCKNDAERAEKVALLTFKEDRKPRYVAISTLDYEEIGGNLDHSEYGAIELHLGRDLVRIMLWDDFVSEFPKEKFV